MDPTRLTLTGCVVDLDARKVYRGGESSGISSQEAALLAYLAGRARETVSREELFREVLGYAGDTSSRALDAAIRRLRRKVEVSASDPLHLQTVHGEGYRLVLPTPGPAPARGLPQWSDCFVGRAKDKEALLEAILEARLVTLHGPGGVGKSRLACEVLTSDAAAFPASATFVPVPAGVDAAGIAAEVAVALDLDAGQDPVSAVAVALRARREGVLVLDAAEVAVEGVADAVQAWLHDGPTSAIVVTSREPLALARERVLSVGPLSRSESVGLLRSRASGAGGAGWDDEEEALLEALAERLDGLPLALELAASRASVLSVASLIDRLDDRFQVLRRHRRGGPRHHQTLLAALEWSWNLLDDEEQRVLVSLSVLEGPFRTEGAERVADTDLDRVEALVRKSLVRPLDHAGRLRLLDGVRDHARLRGAERPAVLEAARERRVAAVAEKLGLGPADAVAAALWAFQHGDPRSGDVARIAVKTIPDPRVGSDLAALALEHLDGVARLRVGVAASRSLLQAAPVPVVDRWLEVLLPAQVGGELGMEVGLLAGRLLLARNRYGEAEQRLQELAENGLGSCAIEARIEYGVSRMQQGESGFAKSLFERARALAKPFTREWARATAMLGLAVRESAGDLDASEKLLTVALEASLALGDSTAVAVARCNLATVWLRQGRLTDARRGLDETVRCMERAGNLRGLGQTINNLGVLSDRCGYEDEAVAAFRKAIRASRAVGDRRAEGLAQGNLAVRLARRGGNGEALTLLEEARREADELGANPLLALLHIFTSRVLVEMGDPAALNHADASVEAVAGSVAELAAEAHIVRGEVRARLGGDLDGAREDLRRAEGLLGKNDHKALEVALAVSRGHLAWSQGEDEASRIHLARARRMLEEMGAVGGNLVATTQTLARRLRDTGP